MAFQTSVLRDGQWVTETVPFEAALRAAPKEPKALEEEIFQRLPCGILSRTIIQSPAVNIVLPVRLRSAMYNDIAFIGDHFIQIKELRNNGQNDEILTYNDFPSRIRNAVVYGTCPEPEDNTDIDGDIDAVGDQTHSQSIDSIEDWSIHGNNHQARGLPPQLLVLVFETGELAFIFLKESPSHRTPELAIQEYPAVGNIPFLGAHFTIDPSSRYLAASSLEDVLVVYEMKAWESLNQEYRATGKFQPVITQKSPRGPLPYVKVIPAVIHSLEFLYPRPQDDYHVILLLTIFRRGKDGNQSTWRFLTYDWEVENSLAPIFSQQLKSPTRLPAFSESPMFLIPLKFQNAFFIVFETSMWLVKQVLSSPEYELSALNVSGPSRLHHGVGHPQWTTWARPFRRRSYFEKTDIIYLAREDGVVMHIEVDSATLMHSETEIGCLDTNISTAFTTSYDSFSDLLIIGGDSGPGGIWKLPGRAELEQVSSIANWSPVVDMATTDQHVSWDVDEPTARSGALTQVHTKPDRIFLASGRGAKGSLVEPRVGVQARVGLDMELGEPIRQAWLFEDTRSNDGSMFVILALPHSSALLHLPADLEDVVAEPAEAKKFSLSSRTIFASRVSEDSLIQITEQSIALVTDSQSSLHSLESTVGITGFCAQYAFYLDGLILVADTCMGGSRMFVLGVDQMAVTLLSSWHTDKEATCLSLSHVSGKPFVILGTVSERGPVLEKFLLDGEQMTWKPLGAWPLEWPLFQGASQESSDHRPSFEVLTTIAVIRVSDDSVDVVAGTRCGHILTLSISASANPDRFGMAEKLGSLHVDVFPASGRPDEGVTAFACCDNNVFHLSGLFSESFSFKNKNVVWATDLSDQSMPAPPIHSIFSTKSISTGSPSSSMLLMLAGTRMLLADFCPHVGPVPRSIPLGGTPTRVLYSQMWQCLIVAVNIDKKPTLMFFDPDSKETIASAMDKDKNPSEFISGLGQTGDRILGLHEWLYVKDGQTFFLLIVVTQAGNLLIVSVSKTSRAKMAEKAGKRLQYWTKYRRKGFKEPIYSVASDKEGLIYCVGKTLYWEVLDLANKKMKPVKEFKLDSPATSLMISEGKILALTTMHSVQVIDHRSNPSSEDMSLLHTDQITRNLSHIINVGPKVDRSLWPVSLVSDTSGGMAGLMVPWGDHHRELLPVFEGKLRNPVRRFARARCRPRWLTEGQNRRPRLYGSLLSTTDGAELLGISLNGTLRHFTLIGLDLWRFLKLIQNMLRNAPEENLDTDALGQEDAARMHIDGDLLRVCLRERSLRKFVCGTRSVPIFLRSLDELEEGAYTESFRESIEAEDKYFALGYEILEHLLAPVL